MPKDSLSGNLTPNSSNLSGNLTATTVILSGGIGNISGGSGSTKIIHADTTENWNAQPSLVSKNNHIYVYTDYKVVDGQIIPGIKIGVANTPLIEIPFIATDVFWGEIIGDITDQADLMALFNNININNLIQDDDSFFILDCGTSTEIVGE